MTARYHSNRIFWVTGLVFATGILGLATPGKGDICQNDDVIIVGSLNIGIDSVCNRNFGFDTFVLSENNLRILFEDTSNSASFPTNDWRITINDSTNGGLSHFSVDDVTGGQIGVFRIEAGANANSIYVDSTDRVGIGRANPVVELHVADGDSPTLRLEQDGTSGFTPQTWDVAGNETNFFIRDATNASRLPFRIRPGALTSSIDVSSSGDVGINDSSPDAQLDVIAPSGDERVAEFQQNKSAGFMLVGLENTANANTNNDAGFEFRLQTSSSTRTAGRLVANFTNTTDATRTSQFVIWTNNNGGFGERLHIDGDRMYLNRSSIGAGNVFQVGTTASDGNAARLTDAGVWTNGSSRKNKEQITPLDVDKAVDAVMQLEPVTYVGKQDKTREQYAGFIAEDVPDLVAMNDRDGISSMDIVAVVTKVVQQQQTTIEQQQATIADLNGRVQELESKLQK